tara:strand:+ start:2536 stop:3495 length:960 start_codon:yes stop_codon:yes gene_type:complete
MEFDDLQSGIKGIYRRWFDYVSLLNRLIKVKDASDELRSFNQKFIDTYQSALSGGDVESSFSASQVSMMNVRLNIESQIKKRYGADIGIVAGNAYNDYNAIVKKYTDAGGKGFYDIVSNVMTKDAYGDSVLLAIVGKLLNDGVDVVIVRDYYQPDRKLVAKGLSVSRVYSIMLPSSQLALYERALDGHVKLTNNAMSGDYTFRVYNSFILPDVTRGKVNPVSVVDSLYEADDDKSDGKFSFKNELLVDYGLGMCSLNITDGCAFDLKPAFNSALIGLRIYTQKSGVDFPTDIPVFMQTRIHSDCASTLYLSKEPEGMLA